MGQWGRDDGIGDDDVGLVMGRERDGDEDKDRDGDATHKTQDGRMGQQWGMRTWTQNASNRWTNLVNCPLCQC